MGHFNIQKKQTKSFPWRGVIEGTSEIVILNFYSVQCFLSSIHPCQQSSCNIHTKTIQSIEYLLLFRSWLKNQCLTYKNSIFYFGFSSSRRAAFIFSTFPLCDSHPSAVNGAVNDYCATLSLLALLSNFLLERAVLVTRNIVNMPFFHVQFNYGVSINSSSVVTIISIIGLRSQN